MNMLANNITKAPQVSLKESLMDSKEMVKNPIHIFEKYRKKLGPTFSFYFGGTKNTIVTADPDLLQHVLKDNNSNYHKSHIQVKRFVEFQGEGLTNSHDDYWLRQRKLLSMGFTRSRLTQILPIQLQVLNDFLIDFEKEVVNGPVDIHNQMVRFTLRSVGKSLFGSQMKEEELEKFANAITKIQAYVVLKVVQPYLIPWLIISGQNRRYHKMRKEADQIIVDYVNKRRKEGSMESDILQLILETPYKDTGEFMNDDTVMIEILQLLVAGNETSTNAASWTFYLLAKHPDYQTKIREEIEATFGEKEIDYTLLHKLEITLNVLDEAMRLYPPFWMIDRVALKKDEFKDLKIPAGTTVVPYIYGVHHNAEVWENPEVFDPNRFNKNQDTKKHPFAHIPFGGGPRVCIGQNMAKMQILLVLSAIIRKYDFKLTSNEPVALHPMMILRPSGAINLSFIKIN